MTRTVTPTRLPADVVEAATSAAEIAHRSLPQQLAYWARIGREFERSPQVNVRAIEQVLAGDGSYDLLGEREQAVVRASWAEREVALRTSLDFSAEFEAQGESYSEVDADGNLVVHEPRD